MAKKVIKKKRKKTQNRKILVIILLAVVLVIMKKQEKEISDKTMLIISNQDVTNDLENDILIQDETIYISFEDIQKYIDTNIYQENDDLIITTSDKKVAKLEMDKNKIVINGSNVSIDGQPFKNEEGKIYLPISEMKNVYDIELNYNKETQIITIDYYSKELIKAYSKKNISVKTGKSKFSKTLEKIRKGNWLIYILEENGWAKVRTQQGKIGYVKYKNLTNFVTERENMKFDDDIPNIQEYLEKDIIKKDISTYKKREKLINTILEEVVNKGYTVVKIKYKKEWDENFEKFMLEIKPILKECGINVIFN